MTNAATLCCPTEERRTDLATKCGLAVADVHRHRGLLRGVVIEGERNRVMFWLRSGRLSEVVAMDYDLRRVG